MPMSVQESPAEVWIGSGQLEGQRQCAAVPVWDLSKEVAIVFITSTIIWPQAKQQEGNTALPINRKLD